MKVSELAAAGGFRALALSDPAREIAGCYVGDLLSWVMGRAQAGNAWITIMSNVNVAAVASLADVACVIFAEGVRPDEQALAAAQLRGINLLATDRPEYEAAVALSKLI